MSLEKLLDEIDSKIRRLKEWNDRDKEQREARIKTLREIWRRSKDNGVVIYLVAAQNASMQIGFFPGELRITSRWEENDLQKYSWKSFPGNVEQVHDLAPAIPEDVYTEIIDAVNGTSPPRVDVKTPESA
ncbi:hypothetical protein IID23_04215 [Patescibacteria group bacterium]|nr:hypothetical protein [Patescibacteria group bacterium]